MEALNLYTIICFIFVLYISHCQEQYLFYKEMQKACKKSQGNCSNCYCWSCPRKEQIDIRFKRLKKYKRSIKL